jgi:hypothetical protein
MHYMEYMLQRNVMKCNCHRLKYLVLYYKRVIALILRNIVPSSISYFTMIYCKIILSRGVYNISLWYTAKIYCPEQYIIFHYDILQNYIVPRSISYFTMIYCKIILSRAVYHISLWYTAKLYCPEQYIIFHYDILQNYIVPSSISYFTMIYCKTFFI